MNMQKLSSYIPRGLSAVTLLVVGALPANAHPGHSVLETSPTHILSSPYHIAVLALSGLTLFFGARLVQRQLPRRVLQVAGVIALIAAIAIWTSHA